MSLQSRIEAAGIPFLTRDEWGASVDRWRWNSGSRVEPIPMTLPVDEFYVHHSVTQPTTDPARDMRVVEDIGLNRFGRFSYSYAIHPPTGTIMEGAGDWIGAHTFGRNSSALAAVAIGNFDESRPPKALINSYGVLIRALKAEGKLRDPLTIRGHRDVRSTGCPGGHLYAAIPDIRHLAALDHQEDDMTPEQAKMLEETHEYAAEAMRRSRLLTPFVLDDAGQTGSERLDRSGKVVPLGTPNSHRSDPSVRWNMRTLDGVRSLLSRSADDFASAVAAKLSGVGTGGMTTDDVYDATKRAVDDFLAETFGDA